MNESLQERYAPQGRCFGCGPENLQGLRIRSFESSDGVVADWVPQEHHEAFPGTLCGGIIGSLLDCHCTWTAAYHLMQRQGRDTPPCTVTAEYTVQMMAPTPARRGAVHLEARVVESSERRARVEGTLSVEGLVTARCSGTFVAVKEDHPAFHRW